MTTNVGRKRINIRPVRWSVLVLVWTGWCWFFMRRKYCWLTCLGWLKPTSEQAGYQLSSSSTSSISTLTLVNANCVDGTCQPSNYYSTLHGPTQHKTKQCSCICLREVATHHLPLYVSYNHTCLCILVRKYIYKMA